MNIALKVTRQGLKQLQLQTCASQPRSSSLFRASLVPLCHKPSSIFLRSRLPSTVRLSEGSGRGRAADSLRDRTHQAHTPFAAHLLTGFLTLHHMSYYLLLYSKYFMCIVCSPICIFWNMKTSRTNHNTTYFIFIISPQPPGNLSSHIAIEVWRKIHKFLDAFISNIPDAKILMMMMMTMMI